MTFQDIVASRPSVVPRTVAREIGGRVRRTRPAVVARLVDAGALRKTKFAVADVQSSYALKSVQNSLLLYFPSPE